MNPWANLTIVIGTQLLIFLFIYYRREKKHLSEILFKSLIMGICFGIPFDLIFGKYLGIYDYVLGFGLIFLFVNGLASFGLWIATVWLLRSRSFSHFCYSTICIGMIYELTNYFFPVWSWQFAGSFIYQELVVIIALYFGLAILVAILISLTTKQRFEFLKLNLK
mgnify:CR=1 FL=1